MSYTVGVVAGLISGILGTLAIVVLSQCTPAGVPSPAHQWDLHDCRKSSEAYRDAGADAELAAYKACADEADQKDRVRK